MDLHRTRGSLALCFWLAACGAEAGTDETPDADFTVAETPFLEIGSGTSEQETILSDVVSVRTTSDGRVVVAHGASASILIFDPAGRLQREIGRPGEGPGEFQGLQGVEICGDETLLAWDASRVSLFGIEGSLMESVAHPRGPDGAIREIGGASSDCERLLVVDRWPQPATAGSWPRALSWYRLDGAGETLLQDFNGRPMAPMAVAGQTVGMRVPFGAVPTWATNGTRVALGLGSEPGVLVFERAETDPRVFRWSATPGALTASNLEIGRRVYGEEAGAEAGILPSWEDFPLPDTKPPHARVLVSGSGAVWVQEYPDDLGGFPEISYPRLGTDPQRWRVFDVTGREQGVVVLPPGFDLMAISDEAVWGVHRDELDVESVRGYRLNLG